LYLSVTPLTGDPDVYVSTTLQHPNQTSYTWRAMQFGADCITINSTTDRNFVTGTYYIAIYAYQYSTYTITAAADVGSSKSITALLNGQPQAGLVGNKLMRYYSVQATDSSQSAAYLQLTITVTARYGDPDLFVVQDDGSGKLPSPAFYTWISNTVGSVSVTIPQACGGCYYLIGVYGYAASQYTVMTSTGNAVSYLQSGVPFSGVVAQDKSAFFCHVLACH